MVEYVSIYPNVSVNEPDPATPMALQHDELGIIAGVIRYHRGIYLQMGQHGNTRRNFSHLYFGGKHKDAPHLRTVGIVTTAGEVLSARCSVVLTD
ncbi:MAG: hypothetical protein LBD79_08240 [Treponema sp.]|nr:hypothetical protein [Treponema sp.]